VIPGWGNDQQNQTIEKVKSKVKETVLILKKKQVSLSTGLE
jgi:hypothetical protein